MVYVSSLPALPLGAEPICYIAHGYLYIYIYILNALPSRCLWCAVCVISISSARRVFMANGRALPTFNRTHGLIERTSIKQPPASAQVDRHHCRQVAVDHHHYHFRTTPACHHLFLRPRFLRRRHVQH